MSLFLLFAVETRQVAAAERPPNIVVILADDLGRGDYSAFGTKDIRTPAIDSLFRDGVSLDNFRANSPVCSPTRASLLSGMYPDRAWVPGVIRTHPENSWGYLRCDISLLPEWLKRAKYESALIGKWHLGLTSPNTPNERGFDHFEGFLGDMMDDYWNHRRHGQNYMRRNLTEIDPEGHATDLFTEWACKYLESPERSKRPFFLYLAYNAPHDPIQPREDWVAKVKAREPQLSETRTKLVALIEHMDAGIGKVLETLKQRNLADNTLVVFTSDNGGVLRYEANNGPWRSEKQHVYEGGLRVPCAIRWPGRIAAGSRRSIQATTMDLMPTLCEAAGTGIPDRQVDGRSFLRVLLEEDEAHIKKHSQPFESRDLYFVRREGGATYGGKTIEAYLHGPWKLLQNNPFAPQELYNLADDPRETTNLVAREKKVLNDLSARLQKAIQRGGQIGWQPPEDIKKMPGLD